MEGSNVEEQIAITQARPDPNPNEQFVRDHQTTQHTKPRPTLDFPAFVLLPNALSETDMELSCFDSV
jgi:hypothetical protein